jgi:hypothetical protein
MDTGLLLFVGAILGGGFIGAILMSLAAMSHQCQEREQQAAPDNLYGSSQGRR